MLKTQQTSDKPRKRTEREAKAAADRWFMERHAAERQKALEEQRFRDTMYQTLARLNRVEMELNDLKLKLVTGATALHPPKLDDFERLANAPEAYA